MNINGVLIMNIYRNGIVAAAIASVFILSSTIAVADDDLVINSGFEDPSIPSGSYNIYPTIPGWTAEAGGGGSPGCGIEIQNNVAGAPYKGKQHVELNSYCSSGMVQTLSTHAGKKYDLCFAYSPRPGITDNKIRVKWNYASVLVLDRSGVGFSNTDWNKYCVNNLKATSASTNLEFIAETAVPTSSVGGYIDAVSIENDD
jgi:hypothetical protein